MYYLSKCKGRVKKEEDRKVGQKGDKPSLQTWVTEGGIRQAVSPMSKGERASMYELLVLVTWQRPTRGMETEKREDRGWDMYKV